jgi:hypothetical protein
MADRRPVDARVRRRDDTLGRRRISAGWLVLASFVALAVAGPVAVLASADGAPPRAAIERDAPRPGESCSDATQAPDPSDVCNDTAVPDVPPGGSLDLGGLLPILIAVVAGAVLALVAVALVLTRRPSASLAPADPGEWWTCRSCGKTNVVGSPRCYACGTWQG